MRLAGPIADALLRGATIVAASPRAARALQLSYADTQRAAGRTIWPSPPICDWDSWLRELGRDYAFSTPDAPVLLSPLQERTLWNRVQREDAALVLSPDSMAALAMEAWARLSAHNAHAARSQSWEQTDAERFRHWAAEFERECARHRWLSASQLEAHLTAANHLTLPAEILLVGFDRLTPAQQDFCATLKSRNVLITEFVLPPQESERSWIVAADQRDEITACALWVRNLLLGNPTARIGIIVPGLADLRNQMDRVFRRVLMPASEDIRQPSPPMPYEFSLGQPLAEIPAICAALLLLRWIAAPLREEEISWLVLSGFVADTVTDNLALARHDALQRRTSSLASERDLSTCCASLASVPALRTLHEHLGTLLRAVDANQILGQSRQPSAWTELVHLLLDRAGWPGQRTADSAQFQALQRWQRLVDDLALLDFDNTRSTFAEFVSLLERQARETIFAPESHDAPIQIMGPLESSGQQFDAVWCLSTDDTRWPMRGRLHPLLPPALQRQFQMPHATPEDDWNLAHAVTARLLLSAPQLIFSYAQREKDAELRPSPLIASLFPPDAHPQAAATFHSALESLRTVPLEEIADDSGVLPWPSERIAGGADVLKRQAACPFQAFAIRRLAAEPLETMEWGLTPAQRGDLLHKILQRLFSVSEPAPLRSRDDLVTALAANQLAAILDAHIEAVFRATLGSSLDHTNSWQQAYLAAEKRRLHTRLSEWLTCEAKRQPFTVEACEQRLRDVHIGELRLTLRADRIDQLSDGSRLLLDYKTGRLSPAAWKGDRPDEPQLPLYAVYGNVENLSGILFAQIRAGETGFDGRIRDAHAQLSTEVSAKRALVTDPYSRTMRDEWARVLQHLAEEFLQGEAAVDPREPNVCEHCQLHSLCRVAELNPGAADESEESHV